MKRKALVALVTLFLCISLAGVLTPPLASPVRADPMETLSLNLVQTSSQPGNTRPHNLQIGDEVIQFTRPNLIVGTNPTGNLDTAGRVTQEFESEWGYGFGCQTPHMTGDSDPSTPGGQWAKNFRFGQQPTKDPHLLEGGTHHDPATPPPGCTPKVPVWG